MKRFIASFIVIVLAIAFFLPEANAQGYGYSTQRTPGGHIQHCKHSSYIRVNSVDPYNPVRFEDKKECQSVTPFGGGYYPPMGPWYYDGYGRGVSVGINTPYGSIGISIR